MSRLAKDENDTPGSPNVSSQIDFCTLGMFIIDEIHFLPPMPSVFDILGGAGSYAALGARIFSPPPLSRSVGWIVDAGSDFPPELRDVIGTWGTSCLTRETPERLTTRGWNGYGRDEIRAFKYTTPKLRLDAESLNEELLLSKCFHLICSPSRCIDMVENIIKKRHYQNSSNLNSSERPIFVWEPVPDLCVPEALSACFEALRHVDVVSPNHAELCGFFGKDAHEEDGQIATTTIEQCCTQWLRSGIGGHMRTGGVVVRAGKDGCFIANGEKTRWIPAYHQKPDRVIDPTGGGNAFLGGLGVALGRSAGVIEWDMLEKAAIWGSVAASFAIEQVGMPILSGNSNEETWNGEQAAVRADELLRRLQLPI